METLTDGGKVKLEIGEHELKKTCPAGKTWLVVANIRIIEENV
jgi:hypothetical protein